MTQWANYKVVKMGECEKNILREPLKKLGQSYKLGI